jgi:hypothetical protein
VTSVSIALVFAGSDPKLGRDLHVVLVKNPTRAALLKRCRLARNKVMCALRVFVQRWKLRKAAGDSDSNSNSNCSRYVMLCYAVRYVPCCAGVVWCLSCLSAVC